MRISRTKFMESIVAQKDDEDYQESGYAACVFEDGSAAIFDYGHCSCYDTWEALSGHEDYHWSTETVGEDLPDRDVTPTWTGDADGLVELAVGTRDPSMPDRIADPDDYDYKHLVDVYRQIIEWNERGRNGGN